MASKNQVKMALEAKGLRAVGPKENPIVHSKADKRQGKNSTHGEQPAKIHARPVPSAVQSKAGYPPGRNGSVQSGYATDGSGKWLGTSHPNTGRQDPSHIFPAHAGTKGSKGMVTR